MDLARFIAAPFGPSLKSPCRLWRTSPNGQRVSIGSAELGRFGEDIARRWLRKQGWKILYRNYRARRGGEVDIVGRDKDTLVFVEVKTRSSLAFGNPADAVDEEKQKLVIRGAWDWMRRLGHPDIFYRFDIVEVLAQDGIPPEVNHIPNAFTSADEYYY
jgi:putative endonuclease